MPNKVLNKPGKLSKEEYRIIQRHPMIGADILCHTESIQGLEKVVRHHHERYDGTGYPYRLSGEDIPLHSRIIAVANAYDAMTSERCCRAPLSQEKACKEIKKGLGTQFDPVCGQTMLELTAAQRQ